MSRLFERVLRHRRAEQAPPASVFGPGAERVRADRDKAEEFELEVTKAKSYRSA